MIWLFVLIIVAYVVHRWVQKRGGWGKFWTADPPSPPKGGPGWGGDNEPSGPLPKKWPGGGPPDMIPDWVFESIGPVFIPKPRKRGSGAGRLPVEHLGDHSIHGDVA